ncbi:type II secretion system protein [Aureliella helgolandensis]|uniref:Type II secretion system protein G n=1 Tax=Aureliella helgolandensis TaxID=2527968 RepID=A0A518G2X3_9BACT|nr:prepilin-type N-terminal cleavage/methylation domain-containing protein [Aureliella helgolandensis]QDV22951.1 hypothetical protein Q31a_12440 [Aureliella helgolandensis]
MKNRAPQRIGFTLVEVLTVVAIIGILVGLIVPAVNYALTKVKQNAMAMEVITLAGAVEQYQQKYGDYPPDGSSLTSLQRHLRKAFPRIAESEGVLLTSFSNASNFPGAVMDGPEALVFFLGGFSSDPVYPFSGTGGPFYILNTSGVQVNSSTPASERASVQYNVDRSSPLYEFKQSQLTLDTSTGLTVSSDEAELFGEFRRVPGQSQQPMPNDLLPVYVPSGMLAPYVYFNSQTYSAGGVFNYYHSDAIGTARPYRSDEVKTTGTIAADTYYRYMEPKTFQLMTAGLDDNYGGAPQPATGAPVYFRFPSGASLDITVDLDSQSGPNNYQVQQGLPSQQLDNATNFSAGILGDALAN